MNVCPGEGVAYDSYYNETDRVNNLPTCNFSLLNYACKVLLIRCKSVERSEIIRQIDYIVLTHIHFLSWNPK